MRANIETPLQPPSIIRYEPALDITQKLQAYRQTNYLPTQSDTKPSHQDILNIMLPPRQWKANDQYFLQYVSHSQPGRDDVELIKNNLEESLLHYQARTQGICPIKEKIMGQTFDEIIRQVTLNSPERGLMLLRVRDQRKMTIAAHQTVYEAGIAYGIKQQAEAEKGMDQLEGQLKALQYKKERLERKKQQLMSKKQSMQQKYRERRVVDQEKIQYELKSLIDQNKYLEEFLQKHRKNAVQEIPEPQEDEDS